ncbi:MAG: TatD family hydrolase [Ardenticatenia bacterium]|nr:TatD family hydrolase [Ardenticatenia bacterium]
MQSRRPAHSEANVLIDTHLHLDFDAFEADRDEVVARAVEAGVLQMITIGINVETSKRAVALAEQYGAVYAAVGVHPNEAHTWTPEVEAELRALAAHPKVVAIGEIGLDYHWERVAPAHQHVVFRAQLDLAAQVGLPVVIHDREAHADVVRVVQAWASEAGTNADTPRGVFHCFSGDRDMARRVIELGFYVGVDGPVTFKNARRLRALVAELPLERLLVETDAPFLTPHPYRGRRNEPAHVHLVAQKVAELHGVSVNEVARVTTRNARRLFFKLSSVSPRSPSPGG